MNLRRLLPLATALMLVFIWGNSLIPGPVSSAESTAVLTQVNSLSAIPGIDLGISQRMIRKCAHFGEYMVLGMLMLATLRICLQKKYLLLLTAALLAVPVVDEGIQLFVPGRSAQVSDVLLDLAGSATGVLVAAILMAVILHKKTKG